MSKKKTKKVPMNIIEAEYLSDVNPFPETTSNNQETEIFNPDELFTDTGGDSGASVSKELFNPKNPKIKTELTQRQINILTKLHYKSLKYWEPLGMYDLRKILDEFVLLSISKDRQSRKEFVETHRETQKNKSLNMFDNLLGRGGLS